MCQETIFPLVKTDFYVGFIHASVSFPAEIDEMNICYVLRDGDNPTNDNFYFSIEDNGELFLIKQSQKFSSIRFALSPCHVGL